MTVLQATSCLARVGFIAHSSLWRTRLLRKIQASSFRAGGFVSTAMADQQDYSQWSHFQLQEHIRKLERRLGHLEQQLVKLELLKSPIVTEGKLIV